MTRFAIFVDYSNLFGTLRDLNLEVDDYEVLYGYIFREAHSVWVSATHQGERALAELRRVYWYAVGSIDHWDPALPQSQTALRQAFVKDKDISRLLDGCGGQGRSGAGRFKPRG